MIDRAYYLAGTALIVAPLYLATRALGRARVQDEVAVAYAGRRLRRPPTGRRATFDKIELAATLALLTAASLVCAGGCASATVVERTGGATRVAPCAATSPTVSPLPAATSVPLPAAPERTNPCAPRAGTSAAVATAPPATAPPTTAPPTTAPPTTASSRATCHRVQRQRLLRIERTLLREYEPSVSPSRVNVDFGCDPVRDVPSEIRWETGSAHGMTLTDYWLRRTGGRGTAEYEVWAVGYEWDYDPAGKTDPYKQGAAFKVRFAHDHLPAATIDDALEEVRLAAVATVRETPFVSDGGRPKHRVSFLTAESHDLLWIADDAGHVLVRGFTGYVSSTNQGDRLPMRIVRNGLGRMVGELAFSAEGATPEHASLFRARFLEAFQAEPPWHVAERLLSLASRLGNYELVPVLLDRIAKDPATEPGGVRRQVAALNALAAITGHDLRYDASQAVVAPAQAAAAYLAACRP